MPRQFQFVTITNPSLVTRRNLNALLALIVILGLVFLISVIVSGSQVGFVFWGSIIIFVGLLITIFVLSRPIDYFEPIWLVFFNATVILAAPLMIVLGGRDVRFMNPYRHDFLPLVETATAILVIGYFCTVVGYYSDIGVRIARKTPVPRLSWNNKWAYRVAAIIIIISSGAYFWFVSQAGSFTDFFSPIVMKRFQTEGLAYVQFLAQSIVLALSLLVVSLKKPWRNPIVWLAMIWGLVVTSSFGARTNVVFWLLLPPVIVSHYKFGQLRRSVIVVLFCSVIIVSAIWLQGRIAFQTGRNLVSDDIIANINLTSILDSTLDDRSTYFDIHLWIVDNVPRNVEPWAGKTILNLFLAPIPRSMWEDKPLALTEATAVGIMINGNDRTGLPPDIVTLFYLHFLFPGVVIGMFVVGVALRWIYHYLKLNTNNSAILVMYPVLWNGSTLLFSVGGLAKLLPFLLIYIVCLTFITHKSSQ